MHPKVLSPDAWELIKKLQQAGLLHRWVLAGGTGLALQFGHRYSEDLDLFTGEKFEVDTLLSALSEMTPLEIQSRAPSTLHALLSGVRFSFLRCNPPLLFEGKKYRGLQIADPRDIAVMKIVAIGGRGSRKDFIDLYFYFRAQAGLSSILPLIKQRFSRVDYNEYHLFKSLVYFQDAETEPMPEMLKKVDWNEVKEAIVREVKLAGKL